MTREVKGMKYKKAEDYKYFKKHEEPMSIVLCGPYGKCAVCGKKTNEHWFALGMFNQFNFCCDRHFELFREWLDSGRQERIAKSA